MTEQTNTPKLRFPEFKNEWSYDLLGDVVTNKSKKFDPKKEEATKDIELDSIEQNTGRLLDTYISNDFTSQKNKFKKDNVLYSKLRPYLNKYYYATIDGVCSSEIWVLNTLNKDVLVNKFLYYFIQTNRFSSVTNKSAGSKMPRADWELVKNIRLYKGSIKEQEKIGYFFSKLDRQIELEEKKLELLEHQKKGYMQKIFSQELRFKDEDGELYPEWRQKKIGELAQIVRGASPRPIKDPKWFDINSDIGWLRIADVTEQNGKINFLEQRLSKEGQSKTRVLKSTHLLLSIAASVGKPVINFVKTGVHDGFLIFLNPQFNIYYMYNWLDFFKKVWNKYGQPGSQVNLNSDIVKSQEIRIPHINEQNKIVDFLESIDKLVIKQSNKVELLKQRKKGLLQKMFV